MEDNKLKVKLKISLKDKDKMFRFVSPRVIEPSDAAGVSNGDKEVSDELEEGEIREDEVAVVVSKGVIEPSSNKRVCPHCGREFNGGKALGGHLRIHTEPKFRPEGSGPGPAHVQDVYPCTLCHKKFRSEKALFGHMRSHPERDYRGMQIPGSGSGHKPAPGSARRPVRVGWKVKGRRGQNGSYAANYTEAAEEVDEEAEASSSIVLGEDERVAAEVLRHFTKCKHQDGKKNNGDDGAKKEAKIMKKREFDEDELYFLSTYFELNSNSNSDNNTTTNNNNNDPPNSNSNSIASTSYSKKEVVRPKKRAKVIETYDDVVVGDDVEEDNREFLEKRTWECDICNKTFPTHQALGGHKSSHSKEKEKDYSGIIDGNGKELEFPQYKCKICDQSFASGQALGGHQRSHYVRSPSLESSPDHGRRGGGNNPFEFDLNLMAKEDFDGVNNGDDGGI